ncbi:Spy/CpxP family protein refolding chaperone [Thermodesulfobacteriota bacterium]
MEPKTFSIARPVIVLTSLILIIGFLGGCHSRRYHKSGHMTERILARADSRVEDLNLTDDQKKKYQDIRLRLKEHLAKGTEARKKLFEGLMTEINKKNPDLEAASIQAKAQMNQFPEFMGGILDLFMEFYNVLDDQQKAQVITHLKKIGNCV